MQRLKKFNKKEKQKKVVILMLGIFVVSLSILIGKTYEIYQSENEVTFINAKVRWPRANEITYTTSENTEVTNVEEALNDLYGKIGK